MSDMMAYLATLQDGVRHMSYGDPDYEECVQASDVVQWAIDEIERLRFAIRRIAEQDATLSVCDGAVTVTMDATLSDAELKALGRAIATLDGWQQTGGYHSAVDDDAATLRGLLERTKGGGE